MQGSYVLLAILIGMIIPVQAGVNATLSKFLGTPVQAAVVNFTVGLLALVGFALILRLPWPAISTLSAAPWWVWIGGLGGAMLVTASAFLIHKIGALALIVALLAGQMTLSILIDHFGWLGTPQQSLNVWRVLGVVLVLAGVYLIRRF